MCGRCEIPDASGDCPDRKRTGADIGDTFLMKDLPGGRKGIALSDGMGSGEEAFRDSTMVVEMLEELLEAGFPVETAVQMMNTALVIGRKK